MVGARDEVPIGLTPLSAGSLALLGIPGLVVPITLIAPIGNGGAFFLGLLASVVAALLAIWLETCCAGEVREARKRPATAGCGKRGGRTSWMRHVALREAQPTDGPVDLQMFASGRSLLRGTTLRDGPDE